MIQITDLEPILYPLIKGDKGDKGDPGTLTNEQINSLKLDFFKANNPVGYIRTEGSNTNPADYLGFGTWSLLGVGQIPVANNEKITCYMWKRIE